MSGLRSELLRSSTAFVMVLHLVVVALACQADMYAKIANAGFDDCSQLHNPLSVISTGVEFFIYRVPACVMYRLEEGALA